MRADWQAWPARPAAYPQAAQDDAPFGAAGKAHGKAHGKEVARRSPAMVPSKAAADPKRLSRIAQLLAQAYGDDGGRPPGAEAAGEGVPTPFKDALEGLHNLLASWGCQSAKGQEREALGKELQELRRRDGALVQLLDELEDEAALVGQAIADRRRRGAELRQQESNHIVDDHFDVVGCCDPARSHRSLEAASRPDVETRATLRARLADAEEELAELRSDVRAASRRGDVQAAQARAAREEGFRSAASLVQRHVQITESQTRPTRLAWLVGSTRLSDFARVRLAFWCWASVPRRRANVMRLLRRTCSALLPGRSLVVLFAYWKVRVLERRRRRAERLRTTLKRFALKFTTASESEFMRGLLWEWFKVTKLATQFRAIESEARARSPEARARPPARGAGGAKCGCALM